MSSSQSVDCKSEENSQDGSLSYLAHTKAPGSGVENPTHHFGIGCPSRKRTLSGSPTDRTRPKRLKSDPRPNYVQLLNSMLKDALEPALYHQAPPLRPSQIGASSWSSEEKSHLFEALARCGRHDLPRITRLVATKSVFEIRDYLDLLERGLSEVRRSRKSTERLSSLVDFPTAVEISRDCCMALEAVGQDVEEYFKRRDNSRKQSRSGDFWNLGRHQVPLIQAAIDESGVNEASLPEDAAKQSSNTSDAEDESVPEGLIEPARFLRLDKLLELSERVFMNQAEDTISVGIHSDWEPTLTMTAFQDLYNLVISVTKRIIQSALFFAMSRLRAIKTGRPSWASRTGFAVQKKDVVTALKVLNLKRDSWNFWARAPRRCGLKVVETMTKKATIELAYDEVERRLEADGYSEHGAIGALTGSSVVRGASESAGIAQNEADGSLEKDTANNETNSSDCEAGEGAAEDGESVSDLSETSSASILNGCRPRATSLRTLEDFEIDEDAYVEAFDQQISLADERGLWAMLGEKNQEETVKQSVEEARPTKPPKRPHKHRPSPSERPAQWIHQVNFKSEWERYPEPLTKSDFSAFARQNDLQSTSGKSNISQSGGGDAVKSRVKDPPEQDVEYGSDSEVDARAPARAVETVVYGTESSEGEDGYSLKSEHGPEEHQSGHEF